MADQPKRSVASYLWSGTKQLLGTTTLVLNAFSIYYIHSDLHKANPTWVSYFAFLPLLDWVPMLDIAGLDRLWCLLPAASIATLLALRALPGFNVLAVLLIIAPMYGFELYRNYHILGHFEQRNWPALLMWSVFRMEWIAMTSMAVLGTDRYQLVPHEQASFTQSLKQVADRLDESVAHPEIVPDNNYSFFFLHVLWANVPLLQQARSGLAWAYDRSGVESASQSLFNTISGLFHSNPTFPDLRANREPKKTDNEAEKQKEKE